MDSQNSKVKIDITAGVIELEGSEEFVSRHLDFFKGEIRWHGSGNEQRNQKETLIKGESKVPGGREEPGSQERSAKKKAGTALPKQVKAEAFEIKPADGPKFEDFFKEKGSPTQHSRRIAIIGYYVTEVLKDEFFTDGNVEFAYKVLKLNRPKYVRQACTDAKNQQQYLDIFERGDGDVNAWVISRLGQIYVEDEAKNEA